MAISNNSTGIRTGVCTSTTRPTAPYEGQHIYETDTDIEYVWNGSAWVVNYVSAASPAFTGTPTAPTATAGTNTTQLATTAFVTAGIAAVGATWQTYTPTWTGAGGTPTLGNGLLTARYAQIQKIVFLQMCLQWGSTTSAVGITEWRFSFPTSLSPTNVVNIGAIGAGAVLDSGTAVYRAVTLFNSGPTMSVLASDGASSVGVAVPFAWTTNDQLTINCTYEVA